MEPPSTPIREGSPSPLPKLDLTIHASTDRVSESLSLMVNSTFYLRIGKSGLMFSADGESHHTTALTAALRPTNASPMHLYLWLQNGREMWMENISDGNTTSYRESGSSD